VRVRQIEVDEQTYEVIRLAALVAGISEADVVARAVRALPSGRGDVPAVPPDPWVDVDIYAVYQGRRVEARFLPATRRVTLTSGPLAGRTFPTPSTAAAAVVAEVNPDRGSPTNGWRFWRVVATNAHLDSIRSTAPPKSRG
jgi:hypothetical protein